MKTAAEKAAETKTGSAHKTGAARKPGAVQRAGSAQAPTATVAYWAMPAALGGMGVLHFAKPEPFDGLIPPELPGSRRTWTYGSGVVELTVAALLAVPRTRRLGGAAALALFIGVFPGNLQMVRAWRRKPVWPYQVIAWGRLPLQLPMILAADKIRRGA